ncbi:hypothetical protein F5144DRAFT_577567 [Chaetomium tenue]|uniref:Uncharacterized protein n=1 Tax=Chaetomium tenue TaxID=1854479 RepID=A0ACB7P7R6_9PEZI|nr:hypothetical protein F5144DRAFT_577567 [Chaetomium globosum]
MMCSMAEGLHFSKKKANLNTLAQMRTFPTTTGIHPPYLPTKCASPIPYQMPLSMTIYRNKPNQVRRTRLVYVHTCSYSPVTRTTEPARPSIPHQIVLSSPALFQ